MVRLYFKAKDKDRIILVTDGMSATGMPDGTYMLGDMEVEVRDGRCTSNGVLAGSVLTLDRGVKNLMDFTERASVRQWLQLPTILRSLWELTRAGEVSKLGRAANITVLSPSAEVIKLFWRDASTIA